SGTLSSMIAVSAHNPEQHSAGTVGLRRLTVLALMLALFAVSLAVKLKPADSHSSSLSSYWSVGTYVMPDRFFEDDPKALATELQVEPTSVVFNYSLPFLPAVPVAAARTGNTIRAPPAC